MRIIDIYKRVGNKYGEQKYRAYVDLQNDVTKYSEEFEETGRIDYHKRFRKGVFTLRQLEEAHNISFYYPHLKALDKAWLREIWKTNLQLRKETTLAHIQQLKSWMVNGYKQMVKWLRMTYYSLHLQARIRINI